jgi:TIR domain-containing protein
VFLDTEDLPAGADYQTRIEGAIGRCALFCFLISPQSVAPKRFTLSEVNIARRRWPNPTGRVLPVMVEPVPMDSVPAYLRAVSILQPEGDLVADVLTAVSTMRPVQWWRSPAAIGAAALVIAVIAGIALFPAIRARIPGGAASSAAAAPTASAATASLSIPALDRVRDTLTRFAVYLKGVGFRDFDQQVTVHLYSKESPLPGDLSDQSESVNAFYYDHAIYVHWSMSNDMSVFLREYAHHALMESSRENPGAGATAVESALGDYLPASFLGSPLIGEGLGKLFNLPTSYIRRLDNTLRWDEVVDEVHARGEVLAGALWSCRQQLGQAAVDGTTVQAWFKVVAGAPRDYESRFAAALAGAPSPAGPCLAGELQQRHLPH